MTLPAFRMTHRSLAADKLEDVLRLIRTPNVGPITFFQLMQRYSSSAEALRALPELSKRGGSKKALTPAPAADIEKEIKKAEMFGARMIKYGEADYPALLCAVEDPPPVIAVLGNAEIYKRDMIGMVGARNASANGCHFGQRLASALGAAGVTVASGMARGIDSFVHKGSLTTGTVAVIAGGIDNVYPPENKALYDSIREKGAIISEQPFGAVPFAGSFPGRNRIIAGMSLGVVVVEASPKSGSLITARLALEYNREVLAVPGSPLDPRSRGCNLLLKQGAVMVESAADVLAAISHVRGQKLSETPLDYKAPPLASDEKEVDSVRRLVEEKLAVTPVEVNILVEQCGLSAANVMAVLLEMELAGRIRRSAGGKVALIGEITKELLNNE